MKQKIILFSFSFCLFLLCAFSVKAEVYNHDIVVNGDFEDELNGWQCVNCNEDDNIAYDGYTHYLSLGNLNAEEEAYQIVTVAADAARARYEFSYDFYTDDAADNDYFTFFVRNHETQEIYIRATVYPSDGVTWDLPSYSLLAYKGETLDIGYKVYNDDENLTYVKIDNAVLTEKSDARLKGRIINQQYNRVQNAKIVIRKHDGRKIWNGETNDHGIFVAEGLSADNYHKTTIIIKKNNHRKVYKRYIEWGESYSKIFKINLQ